jgi:hypothetical protein
MGIPLVIMRVKHNDTQAIPGISCLGNLSMMAKLLSTSSMGHIKK